MMLHTGLGDKCRVPSTCKSTEQGAVVYFEVLAQADVDFLVPSFLLPVYLRYLLKSKSSYSVLDSVGLGLGESDEGMGAGDVAFGCSTGAGAAGAAGARGAALGTTGAGGAGGGATALGAAGATAGVGGLGAGGLGAGVAGGGGGGVAALGASGGGEGATFLVASILFFRYLARSSCSFWAVTVTRP